MTAAEFARAEYRDYIVYKELAKTETNPGFKRVLHELVEHELEDFRFWKKIAGDVRIGPKPFTVIFFKAARALLGLTFVARLLEGGERKAIANYHAFLKTAPLELHASLRAIIEHETYHEQALIAQIKEDKVEFISNIILGINDGLIELSGALVGFAFAFAATTTAALSGLITGVAATLSMSASAYMQARHETNGKNPVKAAFFTGASYGVVVILLVGPFLLLQTRMLALATMLCIVLIIIIAVSAYTSILLERSFRRQLGIMLIFSVGVAVITFLLGTLLQRFVNVGA